MKRRVLVFAILVSGWLFAQEIHLKTRNMQTAPRAGAVAEGSHQIVEFNHSPSAEDLENLLAGGARLVNVLPDNTVVIGTSQGSIANRTGVRWVGTLDPADKLSLDLGTGDMLIAMVEFHSDVSSDQQDSIANEELIELQRPAVLMPHHAIASASLASLKALASHDEVAYIFPANPALLTDSGFSPCAGMLTMTGPIAQYANIVHGWDLEADNAVHLGYVFGSLTTKVSPATIVQSEVVRALNAWANITNVTFEPGTSAGAVRTVVVKFASGAHGDAYPFDGPGGVLAHTFYPVPVNPESIAGDMHLDADENWHSGSDIDIYTVALHEAGHALGLGHSDKPADVMYPYYRRGMVLSANDIGAAQALYGLPGAASAPDTSGPADPTATAAPVPAAPTVPAPPPPPLHLTLDATPSSVQAATMSMTGTLSGGSAPVSVQWQTDHGYSGQASLTAAGATGLVTWSTGAIPLVTGTNSISVTAYDSAQGSATQTQTVSLVPPAPAAGPVAPVSVSITAPAAKVTTINAATVSLAGTASGGLGIAKVTWQTLAGATGVATGAGHWVAPSVPLLKGTNTIMIRAYDANGNNGWTAQVVVRNY